MRSLFHALVVICCAFTLAPSEVDACSLTPPEPYPEPESRPRVVWPPAFGADAGAPVPTNTQVWFLLDISTADPGDFRLLDADQKEIPFDSEVIDLPINRRSRSFADTIVFTPKQPLAPNSSYTFTTPFEDGETGAPMVFSFTTTEGPNEDELSEVPLSLFQINGFRPGNNDDCYFRPDYFRRFMVRFPSTPEGRRLHHEIEYRLTDGEKIAYSVSTGSSPPDLPWHLHLLRYSIEVEPRCVTITTRDAFGRQLTNSSCDWTCFAYQPDFEELIADDNFAALTSCADIPEDMGVDMGNPPEDMGTAITGTPWDWESEEPVEDEEDSATCSSVGGGSAPETPLALLGAACLVALRRLSDSPTFCSRHHVVALEGIPTKSGGVRKNRTV